MAKKSSFFSKITGSSSSDHYDEFFDDAPIAGGTDDRTPSIHARDNNWQPEEATSGELAVDVYQTPDAIVVKALVAGVQPGSIDISLTREMLTVSGTREDEKEVQDENYFQRELYWGSFSRTILLPEEIDVDMAEATEKHGILMIRLPKINKKRQTKLKVRSR
jgi:HSP20 family molecular chaperone IbpA